MILYHLEKAKYQNVWPPQGTLFSDGRWNRAGQWIIYTSATISLAKLEILANEPVLPRDRVCMVIEVNKSEQVYQVEESDLPENWQETPYPTSLYLFTTKFLAEGYLIMKVPSAQSKREFNYLINAGHPEFSARVSLVETYQELFDSRLK